MAERLRIERNLGPRWTEADHTSNAGAALVQFTDEGVTTTFWESFASGKTGHVELQAVNWATDVINQVNELMGRALRFTVKVLTQYEPCPKLCNPMIRDGVWQNQLDTAAGSPVDFQVWHDPDTGPPIWWIGRP
jgi:hypothetical protein